jgi:catechol 2,3-dioxygenase-like lactoylglutathione lyase family enzyme
MTADTTGPARRFLHVCYTCGDTEPVSTFFAEHLALRTTMRTPLERADGAILGVAGDVLGAAAFVYDERGPRASPAVEIQSWVEPALTGTPVTDPTTAGIQSLGLAVADVGATVGRLVDHGCTVVGRPGAPFGQPWQTVRDPRGVTFDLVEDRALGPGATRMRHLRITATDLAASLPWYHGLGFATVGAADLDDGEFLGLRGPSAATAVRLRLPDEPFEAVLVGWTTPASHGRHPVAPNQAGLFRTAVCVDDTRASYQDMVAAGWEFERAPMAVALNGTPVPDMWICFLRDPDGVPFELVGRPRAAFS